MYGIPVYHRKTNLSNNHKCIVLLPWILTDVFLFFTNGAIDWFLLLTDFVLIWNEHGFYDSGVFTKTQVNNII